MVVQMPVLSPADTGRWKNDVSKDVSVLSFDSIRLLLSLVVENGSEIKKRCQVDLSTSQVVQ